jgi:preprotein translocase subunit YajC
LPGDQIVFLKNVLLSATLIASTASGAAFAQTAPAAAAKANVAVGASVMDTKGGTVGTIAQVNGDIAVVDTGTVKASVPTSAFAANGDKGLLMGMTKAELEAAVQGAKADAQQELLASLTPGAAITDQSGGAVGTIDSVDGEFIVVATPNAKVKLPKTAFAKGPNGPVIGMTLAQLEAAAKGSAAGGGN